MSSLNNLFFPALLFLYTVSMAYNTGYGLLSIALETSCVLERRGKLVSQLSQLYVAQVNVSEVRESGGLNYDGIWVSKDELYTFDIDGDDRVNRTYRGNNFTIEYKLGDRYGMIDIDIAHSIIPVHVYYSVQIENDCSYDVTEYTEDYNEPDNEHFQIYGKFNFKVWDLDCTTTSAYSKSVISLYAGIVVAIMVLFILSYSTSRDYIVLRFMKYVLEQSGVTAGKIRSPIIFEEGQEYCKVGTDEGKPFPKLGQLSSISFPDYRCIISDNPGLVNCARPKTECPCLPTCPKDQELGEDLEKQQAAGKPIPDKPGSPFVKNEESEGGEHQASIPQWWAVFEKNKEFEGDELEASIPLQPEVADKVRSYLFHVNFNERYTAVEDQDGSYYFLRLDKLITIMNEEKGSELRIIPAAKRFVAFSRTYRQ